MRRKQGRHACALRFSRVPFLRKSFTSSFIALNFTLCRVEMLTSNKVTLFLHIGYDAYANKELPSLLLLFLEMH